VGKEDAAPFMVHYGVTPQGNFEHGTSILHEAHSLAGTAAELKLGEAETRLRLERVRRKLG